MAEEIVISTSFYETRVAIVEQGLLQEIFIEREHTPGTVGNLYKGKVVRILPGMQSAFVDIGQTKTAFLHITDLFNEPQWESQEANYPSINQVLHDSQEILVQVTKEPIGTKGSRVTTHISLASRFLVYLPGTPHIGISQRIKDEVERDRLKTLLEAARQPDTSDGFIIRTVSEKADDTEILRDAELLKERWQAITATAQGASAPQLIYEDLPLHLRVIQDIINQDTAQIFVDNHDVFLLLQRFISDFIPEKLACLQWVNNHVSLFDAHHLEDQIEAALDKKVLLKSGGYLIVEQTEAMTTVDVNTGAFVGRLDVEETIYKTNLEAATAIPRQLRLRNIGGIVVIDFIDMIDEEHKRQMLRILEKGQQTDRVKWNITPVSKLGLVEMTRKRTYKSLLKMLCAPCHTCSGKGFAKTVETVCLEIFREIRRKAIDLQQGDLMIMAEQTVIDRLLDEDANYISELAEMLEVKIRLQVEASYTQEQFDIVLTART